MVTAFHRRFARRISYGVFVKNRPFVLAATAAVTLSTALLPTVTASADASTYPPSIGPIVEGDVTSYQWALRAVNATEAWTAATGAGVVVADIDTGADANHPDLQGQIVPGAIVEKGTDGKLGLVPATIDQTSADWYGHGSHVAGIIAANDNGVGMTGIAPDASVMPIDLLPRRDGPRSEVQFFRMVTAGIDYAVTNGANVINMSLGGQSSGIVSSPHTDKYLQTLNALCDSVQAATAAGTVVVASAGNSGDFGNPEMRPASCPTAITVAALAPSLDRTFWSSYDAAVDISAPGQDILSVDSTVADAVPSPHVEFSGTSMAAPLVAGVAALLMEQNPGWTAEQVADQITSTAKDLDVPGRDPNTGFGIVDAAAALGVSAPAPQAQDDFATWAEGVYGDKGTLAEVGWTTPAVDSVTGYTVTVHTDTGTTDYDVDGVTVRAQVDLPRGAWWTVTAHTTAGDVSTYPQAGGGGGGGDSPDRLTGLKLDRNGDHVSISWDPPTDPTKIDVIRGYVGFGRCSVHGVSQRIKVDQSADFPDHITLPLPTRARWCDARASIGLINKDDDGNQVGGRYQSVRQGSPALYGSSIRDVVGAGPRAVEVVGAVSELNAKRVCGNLTCVGETATVLVDWGRSVQRFDVTYTSAGSFHLPLVVDRGTDRLTVKVIGPLRLDSGPFRRVSVGGKRGGGGSTCQALIPGC